MNPEWEGCGFIAPGGTVLNLASTGDGTQWAASPAGFFAKERGKWQPVTRGFPFAGTSSVLSIQKTIFVSGLPHGLVRSPDLGKTWHSCWTDQTEAPITCLVASPNYNRDRVLLAGTDGDGILRSTDGGRFWHLENFGLRSFSILSMVAAPIWGRHERLYAGTEAGVYESPNGGRAWRQIGAELRDKRVTALVTSPDFEQDKTLYAGTESDGVYVSKDGGWNWTPLFSDPASLKHINCLWITPQKELLIGTGTDGIFRMPVNSSSMEAAAGISSPVLCFSQQEDQLFAGTSESGLLTSIDDGKTWTPDPGLRPRHFNLLAISHDNTLLAAGMAEGVWISKDDGAHWEVIDTGYENRISLGLAVGKQAFCLATASGVLVSRDGGASWVLALHTDHPITAIACFHDKVWAGDRSGKIVMSGDGGETWQPLETPIGKIGIAALAVSPYFTQDRTLVAVVVDEKRNQMKLWRSTDAGKTWHLWLDEKTDWPAARLSLNGRQGERTTLGLGTKILVRDGESWRAKGITTDEAPISAVITTVEPQITIAAIADELLATWDGETWELFSQGLAGASIVALVTSPNFGLDHTVWGLSREGGIWKRVVA